MGALQPSSTSSMIKALVLLSMGALVITDMLATPMPTVATTMAKGLLSLPLPPSLLLILTTATTALATTVMLATLTPMVVTTMESKKEQKCQQMKTTPY